MLTALIVLAVLLAAAIAAGVWLLWPVPIRKLVVVSIADDPGAIEGILVRRHGPYLALERAIYLQPSGVRDPFEGRAYVPRGRVLAIHEKQPEVAAPVAPSAAPARTERP